MQYYQPLLLTPGPTPVPDSIMSAIHYQWLATALKTLT